MSEWQQYKLGDLCTDINYGYTASANDNPVGPKFLRITDIVPQRIDWKSVPYCIITDANYLKYKLEKGDILIARTGATTGYNYTFNDNIDAIFASYLIRYRINRSLADPYFINYLLKSNSWKGFVEGIIGGSAQPGANAKLFADFDISLPTLSEQCSIVSILSSLDDKIDLLRRQNKTLEQIAETLFRQWFIEEAKEDWEITTLSKLCTITRGASPRPIIEYVVNGTVPWIKIADATRSSSFFIDSTREFIIEQGVSKSVKVFPGDLILSNSATCGFPYLVEIEGCIHDGWLLFRSIHEVSNLFLFFFLKQINRELNSIADGSVQDNLNTTMLKEYPVNLPDNQTLTKFDSVASGMTNKIKANLKQIRILEKLRDSLLPMLMKGDIGVKK